MTKADAEQHLTTDSPNVEASSGISTSGTLQPSEEEIKPKEDNSPVGFVLSSPGQASFIRWSESEGKISGQLQIATISEKRIQSASHVFTGEQTKDEINVTFAWTDGFAGKSWTGKIGDNKLTLFIPSSDGKIASIEFSKGSIEDYNNAVTVIQRNLSKGLQQEEAEKQQAQLKHDQEVAVRNIVSALDSLRATTKDLSQFNFNDVLGDFEKDWSTMKSNYQTLRADSVVQPFDGVQLGTVQSDLGTLESDRGSISSDEGSLESSITSLGYLMDEIQRNINKLKNAWEEVQGLRAVTSLELEDINAAITDAQKQIKASQGIQANAVGQVAVYVAKADKLLKEASNYVATLKPNDSE
ncbi:hypothetical protein [Cohnella soli]|uniref:Uncharacterized protein n=1 Tax=Cohnella soli TaxID=425005 RepID=A0ABW0HXL9_9BACL